jgi:hypothetical protein
MHIHFIAQPVCSNACLSFVKHTVPKNWYVIFLIVELQTSLWNFHNKNNKYTHKFNNIRLQLFGLLSVLQFSTSTKYVRSRDSAVGIATGYGLDDRGVGVRVPVGSTIFSSPCRPDRLWGLPNLLSLGVKRQGREAGHSPPNSAEVKKIWIYTSTPPYAFMG